ncbi:MAG: CvpA family protein [Chloroflexota bacterium]
MVSIEFVFYIMIIFFGMVGAIRGWQKEVIALAGLIGAVAFLHQFGNYLISIGNLFYRFSSEDNVTPQIQAQREFWIQAIFFSLIAFFSYQIISSLADRAPTNSRGERVRSGFQSRFIGLIIGMVNGYLLVGSLWGFLEYQLVPNGYEPIARNAQYAFDNTYVVRSVTEASLNVAEYLPLSLFGSGIWLLLFFISFFVVIIALI